MLGVSGLWAAGLANSPLRSRSSVFWNVRSPLRSRSPGYLPAPLRSAHMFCAVSLSHSLSLFHSCYGLRIASERQVFEVLSRYQWSANLPVFSAVDRDPPWSSVRPWSKLRRSNLIGDMFMEQSPPYSLYRCRV